MGLPGAKKTMWNQGHDKLQHSNEHIKCSTLKSPQVMETERFSQNLHIDLAMFLRVGQGKMRERACLSAVRDEIAPVET